MKKIIYVLFCTLLVAGCNQPKNEPKDILHPDFDVRYKKLLKDGFHLYPEGGHSFFVKQIGDTFLSYQFEDLRYLTKKGKPKYVSARFSINSFHTDSINLFFHERGYIRICEQSSDPLTNMFDIFYVKHPLKNFIFSVKIDKENYTMSLMYSYPQIKPLSRSEIRAIKKADKKTERFYEKKMNNPKGIGKIL